MIYFKQGIKKVQDLHLKDFSWKIKSVTYDWEKNKVYVEVIMWEIHQKHSRTFEFDCDGVWTDEDALSAILNLQEFKYSVKE